MPSSAMRAVRRKHASCQRLVFDNALSLPRRLPCPVFAESSLASPSPYRSFRGITATDKRQPKREVGQAQEFSTLTLTILSTPTKQAICTMYVWTDCKPSRGQTLVKFRPWVRNDRAESEQRYLVDFRSYRQMYRSFGSNPSDAWYAEKYLLSTTLARDLATSSPCRNSRKSLSALLLAPQIARTAVAL